MCTFAAAGLALTLLSTAAAGYSVYEQGQATNAENKARRDTQENALTAFRDQASQVNLGQQHQAEAATNAKIESGKRAAEARATARTASGEAGIAGLSVDNLMSDFYRQEATYRAVTDTNLAYSREASQRQLNGIKSQTDGRLAAFRPEPIPDYLASGLRISANTYAGIGKYNDATRTDGGK